MLPALDFFWLQSALLISIIFILLLQCHVPFISQAPFVSTGSHWSFHLGNLYHSPLSFLMVPMYFPSLFPVSATVLVFKAIRDSFSSFPFSCTSSHSIYFYLARLLTTLFIIFSLHYAKICLFPSFALAVVHSSPRNIVFLMSLRAQSLANKWETQVLGRTEMSVEGCGSVST